MTRELNLADREASPSRYDRCSPVLRVALVDSHRREWSGRGWGAAGRDWGEAWAHTARRWNLDTWPARRTGATGRRPHASTSE